MTRVTVTVDGKRVASAGGGKKKKSKSRKKR